ncbi:MAG: hypothetical protein KJ668_13240, partial [Proteobacteria bacterium]|nr:hypothetical protein [Pseudomonadota bacterium]
MKNQCLEPAVVLIKKIYALYDTAIKHFDGVCEKKCSSCCTCNVTLTSLEAGFLIAALTQQEKEKLLTRLKQYFPQKRYIPKMTSNMFARLCMEDGDVPDEHNDPSWGEC